ncbi:LAMI_0B04522g1_1 [Lachancea mirantina]|uniref:LAMI_0B04522g1_1 n=1 Tax=Lachancea mirantina TaxID=1230905 RepID=A0A1G4IVF3_9SACH|nr:LAMI_0B04522g1_1 [Lachancea mirantina]
MAQRPNTRTRYSALTSTLYIFEPQRVRSPAKVSCNYVYIPVIYTTHLHLHMYAQRHSSLLTSISQQYILANRARSKLLACAATGKNREFELRVLVGHANLLDRVVESIQGAEESGSESASESEEEAVSAGESVSESASDSEPESAEAEKEYVYVYSDRRVRRNGRGPDGPQAVSFAVRTSDFEVYGSESESESDSGSESDSESEPESEPELQYRAGGDAAAQPRCLGAVHAVPDDAERELAALGPVWV